MKKKIGIFKRGLYFIGTLRYVRSRQWPIIFFRIFKKIFFKYLIRRNLIVANIHGNKMYLELNRPGISKALLVYGTREEDHRQMMCMSLKVGDSVLDIGANIGYYVIMGAGLVGNEGKICAVEPDLQNIEILRKNVEINHLQDRVDIKCCAISNYSGNGKFYLYGESNLHSLHPVTYSGEVKRNWQKEVSVPVYDIYDFVENYGPFDFIRMDIEGAEVEVLEGIVRLLNNKEDFRPRIIFETHRPKYDEEKHSIRKPLAELFHCKYHAAILASSDETKSKMREIGYSPFRTVKTDGYLRGLYKDISNGDAETLICDIGFVRTVLLAPDEIELNVSYSTSFIA